jgi:trk system potassium uptake protein TrkA
VHIVVVGCGRVGSDLATQLCEEGHSVVIIDKNPDAFKRLGSSFNGEKLVGSGFDRQTLAKARANSADGFAAVTNGDNTNILCARIAQNTYQIVNVVARIYDPRRAKIYERLGIPTVATVDWTTLQVKRWLLPTDDSVAWSDNSGTLHLVERILPDAFAGEKLHKLNDGEDVRVVSVVRGSVGRLDVDELYGQEDDIVQFLVTEKGLANLNTKLGLVQS